LFSNVVVRSTVVGLTVGSLTAMIAATAIVASTPQPAQAATSSEMTVTAAEYDLDHENAPMPDLSITVGQTTDLVKQGITVSWEGALHPSSEPQGVDGGRNFMQVFQCWGEDLDNPGHPDRTTCQYGGLIGSAATRDNNVEAEDVHPNDVEYTAPGSGFVNPTYTSIPFRAVTGEVVESVVPDANGILKKVDVDVNTNPFFTQYTTNEVKWAGSGSEGSNSIKFEIQTVMEAPGLGCGTPRYEGAVLTSTQDCWLVVLPRGSGDNGEDYITKSGLFWDSWQHHLAVRLTFKPVGVRCEIGAAEKQLAGSELMTQAIASWQPQLCLQENGAAFVVNSGSEEDAAFKASLTTPNPLAMTSRAYEATAQDPNVYAPIAVSGAAVVFNIDHRSRPVEGVPADVVARDTTPFTEMKLTPRLLAKLLTSSYISSLPSGADFSHMGFENYDNPGDNAFNLTTDPDFLAVNDPEWQYQDINSPSVADALIPMGRSDLAWAFWSYIIADPDARAFLNGEPDPWGMKVNPWYSSNAAVNPTGVAKEYPRDDFPKADPVEKPSTLESDPDNGTGSVNLVSWRPYSSDFEAGAYYTLRSDGLVLGEWQRFSTPPKWGKQVKNLLGSQKVIALSTTGSAHKYQTITASLLNPAGNFVAPSTASMSAAVAAMTPTNNSSVVGFDFGSAAAGAAPNAYPLTMPVYAALNPLMEDAPLRAIYASFIRYAVQAGQTPGSSIGNLPEGYAPIPATWVTQAMNAASAIQAGIKPTTPVDLGSLPQGSYVPSTNVTSDDSTITGAGDIASLESDPTAADPNIGALAGAVPLSLLTGVASGLAVPLFTRARRRAEA
jgi:hypothetical protein